MLMRALHLLPPEVAHGLALRALQTRLVQSRPAADPRLETELFGRRLPHPLGLAAGFDKDALAVPGLFGLGFSLVEIGTVTPRPQAGNPEPRLFRLKEDRALINRMGFNNAGRAAVAGRLERLARQPGLVGANVGINKESPEPATDYAAGIARLGSLVDYLVINVSSPNTPGLRALQAPEQLHRLLDRALEARERLARRVPLLVKIAPDLEDEAAAAIGALALERGIDGLILTNTTVQRPRSLRGRARAEAGGLSGPPLFGRSTALLHHLFHTTGGRLPLIGVGGIDSGASAYTKIRAGASALQLYTALVYEGPGVIGRVLRELAALLERDGFASVGAARGTDVRGTRPGG